MTRQRRVTEIFKQKSCVFMNPHLIPATKILKFQDFLRYTRKMTPTVRHLVIDFTSIAMKIHLRNELRTFKNPKICIIYCAENEKSHLQ